MAACFPLRYNYARYLHSDYIDEPPRSADIAPAALQTSSAKLFFTEPMLQPVAGTEMLIAATGRSE